MKELDGIEPAVKVSVCIVTYNQEDYVRQCLQSIVDQKTDFNFEVIVGDDCSTDATRAIVQEFSDNYPSMVKAVFHKANLGPLQNLVHVHRLAKGEYVAHIDGDDYMLPGKLQAQVDCLDSNPDVSFAAHAVNIIGTEKYIGKNDTYPEKGTLEDILKLGTYFVHSSVMTRKEYDLLGAESNFVDYNLYIERASKGLVFLDQRIFGGYRMHDAGISKSVHYKPKIEAAYEKAFDRSLELGVSAELVQSARLHKSMSFAISRYLSGDVEGYKSKIFLEKKDMRLASRKHVALHLLRGFPWLIGLYFWVRT